MPKLRITSIKSNCIASKDTQTHTHTQFQKIKHKRKKNYQCEFQCGKESQREKNTLNAFPNN